MAVRLNRGLAYLKASLYEECMGDMEEAVKKLRRVIEVGEEEDVEGARKLLLKGLLRKAAALVKLGRNGELVCGGKPHGIIFFLSYICFSKHKR